MNATEGTASFDAILREFLDELDAVRKCDPGITQPHVRELVTTAVVERLIHANSSQEIPCCFGLLDDEGEPCGDVNTRVRAALERFVGATEASEQWRRCASDVERQALVVRESVRSGAGSDVSAYVGDGPAAS